MTDNPHPLNRLSLVEQRRALRRRLQAQRQLVARLLEPTPSHRRYQPRSKTMRFLTQQPALAAGLLAVLATLFIGSRFMRSMSAALAVTRMLSAVSGRAEQHDVPTVPTTNTATTSHDAAAADDLVTL